MQLLQLRVAWGTGHGPVSGQRGTTTAAAASAQLLRVPMPGFGPMPAWVLCTHLLLSPLLPPALPGADVTRGAWSPDPGPAPASGVGHGRGTPAAPAASPSRSRGPLPTPSQAGACAGAEDGASAPPLEHTPAAAHPDPPHPDAAPPPALAMPLASAPPLVAVVGLADNSVEVWRLPCAGGTLLGASGSGRSDRRQPVQQRPAELGPGATLASRLLVAHCTLRLQLFSMAFDVHGEAGATRVRVAAGEAGAGGLPCGERGDNACLCFWGYDGHMLHARGCGLR